MKYGSLPKPITIIDIRCEEMMFYQYLPIKMINSIVLYEPRLNCFSGLIDLVCQDFIREFGIERFNNSYIYLTAKYLYQNPHSSFNRLGWHSDGFLTDDINYIWSDKYPTVFNCSDFNLSLDDSLSMKEMEEQAQPCNDITFLDKEVLRLNQFNIHRVADVTEGGMRTFLKISFSKDKYDLIGNSHNHLMNYNWEMKQRKEGRNIPQSIL